MNENMMKKFNIEIKISNYLKDLEAYAEGAYNYLIGNPMITDKEEIIVSLECVPDIIKTIDKLIEELEIIYENEQLQ